MKHGGVLAALGVGLLVADVLLPVPSSIVMVAHGPRTFRRGSAARSFHCWEVSVRRCLVLLSVDAAENYWIRVVTHGERARANDLLARWGVLAIIVTRPIPLLAETVAIMSGASSLGCRAPLHLPRLRALCLRLCSMR